jgi:hypothetical protein
MIAILAAVLLHLPPMPVCPTLLPGDGTHINQAYEGVPHGPKRKAAWKQIGAGEIIRQADHHLIGACAPAKRKA